jgi:glycosyltransferase involved in cell wall biosynthesis
MAESATISDPNIPQIDPVPAGVDRPFWSVMIPTFNCANYLGQTLESVLAQDPGPDLMQIEVIDNCSSKDDPESVVREVGKGRVHFHRHPHNLGMTANFNACLQRSRGRWVHVLHGDDYVLPGFYSTVGQVAERNLDVGLVSTRGFIVDETGELETISGRIRDMERLCRDPNEFLYGNRLMFCATVVSRAVVERVGGFATNFTQVTDWELWVRCLAAQGVILVNQALVCYRQSSDNQTSNSTKNGQMIRERALLGVWFAARHPGFDLTRFRRSLRSEALQQVMFFRRLGDLDAAYANWQVAEELSTPFQRWLMRLKRKVRGIRPA